MSDGTLRIKTVVVAFAWMILSGVVAQASDTFQKPTAEELAMTSLPGYPGASAVVLFREQITTDDMHSIQRYERVKILTEEGKKYANVELRFIRTNGYDEGGDYRGSEETVEDIQGRTIHPDGTIIPFTGKPYQKTIEKTKDLKYQAKVFTLPDVEVGSIIEYRYATRFNDTIVEDPQWYIQGDLFVRQAHYVWHPTMHDLIDNNQRPINSIAWFPILPAGTDIKHTTLPAGGQTYELSVKDIPPTVEEDYMPPLKSYSYRVLFSFTAFRTRDEFWKEQGKDWSKHRNSFMKSNSNMDAAVQKAIAGATTTDAKVRKLYALVMSLENTDYTRERQKTEDGKISTVADVLGRERGSSSELTELFVAMARSAGLKSYLMLVPDRSEGLFISQWMSFNQFNDEIAIVNVDGTDVYLDPGERYCAYGHLAWQHMFTSGLRQVDGGTAFADTKGDGYAANRTTRVANLQMDEHGEVTGKIDVAFTGAEALRWRHIALRGDEQSLNDGLREMLEGRVPHSLEVKVSEIKNLKEYEQPLQVSYAVTGTLGTATGKRLVLPVDLFESGSVATFAQEKRETPVDFEYPRVVSDALRINFKSGFEVEALPKSDKYNLEKRALYSVDVESTPTSFTTRRSYAMGDMLFMQKEYPELRTFYTQLQSKDKESVVLKAVPVVAEAKGGN
jgi:Domain of Unknown Function with PDB structure (DUF3857)/Transglutaminase-like superfamily